MTLTAIIVTGFAIDTAFIITDYMKKYIPAVILKTLASLVFVYLGIYCAQLAGGGTYAHLIIAGLALGCAGDFFLNLRFVSSKYDEMCLKTGTAFFFAGHAVYIAVALISGSRVYIAALPMSLVLCLTIITILLRKIDVKKELKPLGIIYFIIMISTFSFAAGLLIMTGATEFTKLLAAGTFIFMISDILYILTQFGKIKRSWYNAANLITYYIAQVMIALTIAL